MFIYKIDSIDFNTGDNILLEENSAMMLVGPNNSGKSAALKWIENGLTVTNTPPIVVKEIKTTINGSPDDLNKWLDFFPSYERNGRLEYYSRGSHASVDQLENYIRDPNQIFHFLVRLSTTVDRLTLASTKKSISISTSHPIEYIHFLQADSKLLEFISREIRFAFGKDLIINWGGASEVWFHVGDQDSLSGLGEKVDPKYLAALNKLPKLDVEGDGIRSYVACLLALYCGANKILLVDEPEAFLHPSQARRLGYLIAKAANERMQQIIVATHSADVIKGAFSTGHKVSVCRLERSENNSYPALLDSESLKSLWSKPLLQTTNAIQGIFHNGVIVCEAHADCDFFETLLKRCEGKGLLKRSADVYFVNGGGKGEISSLVESYNKLQMSVVAICDFDILRRRGEFIKTLNSVGGDFDMIEGDYNYFKDKLDKVPSIRSIADFIVEMSAVTSSIDKQGEVKVKDKERISELLSQSSKWSSPKKKGYLALPEGDHKGFLDLLGYCKSSGLFIIPIGELEGWWSDGPADKTEWVKNALTIMLKDPDSLLDAEKFLLEVLGGLELEDS